MRTQQHDDAWTDRPVRRLLYILRWVILAFVLICTVLVDFHRALVQKLPIEISVVVLAIGTLIVQAAGRRWRLLRNPLLGLITDIMLVSVVSYFSDGIQSPFYPLYYMVVISAAVSFGLSGALICAAAVAVISLGVDWLSPTIHVTRQLIAEDVISEIPYLFLIALVVGALRTRIRALDEAASALRASQAANERELELAALVQRAQLPASLPEVEGLRIRVLYKPAREVGGDLYDLVPVGKDGLDITVADASGKGVPAALMVSNAKYAIRAGCAAGPVDAMTSANKELAASTTDYTFVTMIYGTLDVSSGTFKYVNAGHMPPIIVRPGGDILRTGHSDPPLGISTSRNFEEQSLTMERGDTLVLYTDGVTDALAKGADGIAVFEGFLTDVADTDMNEWGDLLLERTQAPEHLDDLTMLCIRLE